MQRPVILTSENLSVSFGDKLIFDSDNWGLHEGDKLGILGVNGSGKSTLLRTIAGKITPNTGEITLRSGLKLAYLEQDPLTDLNQSVLHHVIPDSADEEEYYYKAILSRLGLELYDSSLRILSGGQRRKADLAKALALKPDLLLLDEPTNHLDLESIEWLQEYLINSKISLIFVTHDRYFLDSVCNRILNIERGKFYFYEGNYSAYLQGKLLRETDLIRKETRRQAQLSKELIWLQRGAKARTSKPKHHVDRVKELLSKSYLISDQDLHLSFQTDRLGKTILELHKLRKAYDDKLLFSDLDYNFQPLDRIGLVGPNGCGKTTLLNILTGATKADSGSIKVGQNTNFAYYKQDEESFDPEKRVYDYIAQYAETVRTADGSKISLTEMLNRFLFDGKMQQAKLSTLSGGERKRLFLLKSLLFGTNFIILDEPTNDLDIRTLEVLEDYLDSFRGCLLVVSHDRYFLDRCIDYLFIMDNGKVRKFAGNYSDYLLVKRFEEEEKEEAKKPVERPKRISKGLNYNEQREFALLAKEIDNLENEIAEIEKSLGEGKLSFEEYENMAKQLSELHEAHDISTIRWIELSDKSNA
ncbi:MAG: ABC-F family ATP-binding cassette domain-containing protein [Candidatus Cloacimonetes bacterium]|jgi:ATP-binding cassette subfamily F protein uup|nr:ABC-F family ATP-binding cassette domain-containing protein [Candidatus Cloacimonadota bacterium]NLO44341.1 ABC-F family ATP-binding cassette domain-containing protein [Candidatus Cloacimonadota bacterium]